MITVTTENALSLSQISDAVFTDFINNKKSQAALLNQDGLSMSEHEIIEVFQSVYTDSLLVPSSEMVRRIGKWIHESVVTAINVDDVGVALQHFKSDRAVLSFLRNRSAHDEATEDEIAYFCNQAFNMKYEVLPVVLQQKVTEYLNQPIDYEIRCYRSLEDYENRIFEEESVTYLFRHNAESAAKSFLESGMFDAVKIVSGCSEDQAVFTKDDISRLV